MCPEKELVSRLFSGCDDTLILSYLGGHMGRAKIYSDNAVQVIVGDFCFFAGTPREDYALDAQADIITPTSAAWECAIEKTWGDKVKKCTRYSIKKERDIFDYDKLRSYVSAVPSDYTIAQIDSCLYDKCAPLDWACDFFSQFDGKDDYMRRGLGFVATKNGEPVAGGSSYSIYDGGMEIEVDTREDHRRRGLALGCCSAFILSCKSRGLYASWDAQNPGSVALAEKLGYHVDKPYTVYVIGGE